MAANIPSRDFTVWIGNSGTVDNPAGIVFALKAGTPAAPVNLAGSEFIFRATNGTQVLRKSSAGGAISIDLVTARVTIPITVAETRAMVLNQPWSFEIERRVSGAERTVLRGRLLPAGGSNDDA